MIVELIQHVPLPVLTQSFVEELWQATCTVYTMPTNMVTSIAIVSDEEIHGMNKEYRNMDKPTDVLSFRYDDQTAEIVISAPRVYAQAKQYGHTETEEAAFLVVHGFLHNAGLDHERSEQEEKEMRQLEQRILSLCNLEYAR